jgi:hypothetical protein
MQTRRAKALVRSGIVTATSFDIGIASAFLLIGRAASIGFSAGIRVASGVDLLLVCLIADRLRDLPCTRSIGGLVLIVFGGLLALQIL